jgi:hypothetical protein
VAYDFLAQPGEERVIVVEVLHCQPDHRYPAALPLQMVVAVIDAVARAAA